MKPQKKTSPRRALAKGGTTACSPDGAVSFSLAAHGRRLHVERVHHAREGAARVIQAMVFNDDAAFVRWCDADTLKFSHPMLYANLRRTGRDLFDRMH
jgi:hypothetical protein